MQIHTYIHTWRLKTKKSHVAPLPQTNVHLTLNQIKLKENAVKLVTLSKFTSGAAVVVSFIQSINVACRW